MRELLDPQCVLIDLKADVKKDVLQVMAEQAAPHCGENVHTVFDVLWEREQLGTTGVGMGLAIPHGRLPHLKEVKGFFARLAEPIAFESTDKIPVDLVFLLLAPESAGADHLHALATVSRALRDSALCAQLRAAKNEAAMYRLLTEVPAMQAA